MKTLRIHLRREVLAPIFLKHRFHCGGCGADYLVEARGSISRGYRTRCPDCRRRTLVWEEQFPTNGLGCGQMWPDGRRIWALRPDHPDAVAFSQDDAKRKMDRNGLRRHPYDECLGKKGSRGSTRVIIP